MQINECLRDLSPESVEKIFFAYEPFWAISDGKGYVDLEFLRIETIIKEITNKISMEYSVNSIVLYGGSISDKNIKEINKLEINGFLIGAASTNKKILNEIFNSIT